MSGSLFDSLKRKLVMSVGAIAALATLTLPIRHSHAADAPVSPPEQAYDFDLPEQSLTSSLNSLGIIANRQVLFAESVVRGIVGRPVSGRFRVNEALKILLRESGLVFEYTSSNVILVRAPKQESSAQPSQTIASPSQTQLEQSAAAKSLQIPIEGLTVSASRINISGYEQPTPVTVVDAEAVQRDAQTNVGAILRNLPSVGLSTSPDNSVSAQTPIGGGFDSVALRNLGSDRTLVLINGVRTTDALYQAGTITDVSTIPSVLLQRVDVVTGGASAAWGSDAVAGVVNFILNNRYEGLQLNVQGGNNQRLNKVTGKAQLAYGTPFAGGRGHTVLGLSYLNSPLLPYTSEMRWRIPGDYVALTDNPAYTPTNGQPQLITSHNVRLSTRTSGGLIASGPLKGIQFVGPNGTPAPFNFGNVSGGFCTQCDGQDPVAAGQNNILSVKVENMTLYNYNTYELSDAWRTSLEINASHVVKRNTGVLIPRDIPIKADNAFLDPSIATRMAQLGLTSFTLGTMNSNNLMPNETPQLGSRRYLGMVQAQVWQNSARGVFRLEGDLGGSWKLNSNVQWSHVWSHNDQIGSMITANYNDAIDAVRVTEANAGTSGLPVGTVVCRSTLTSPTNGCKPLNVFGVGVASQDALDYINPGPEHPDAQWGEFHTQQVTALLSLSGEAFALPAGSVAVVGGLEYRKEKIYQIASPLSYIRGYLTNNQQFFDVQQGIKEAFGEIAVPILKDQYVRSLDLNAAGRVTHYPNSGTVVTWKGGLVSQVIDDVRVRGTLSRDIRAPSLFALYYPGTFTPGLELIPDQTAPVDVSIRSNPLLRPERATTLTAGVVLTPKFMPGLNISADWYSIRIKGVFFTPSGAQALAQCRAGLQMFCSTLDFNATGQVTFVRRTALNASRQKNEGVDLQLDYTWDAFNGQFAFAAIGNYLPINKYDTPVASYNAAGEVNADRTLVQDGAGIPKLRGTLSLTYSEEKFSGTIQTRYIGSAKLSNMYHEGSGPGSIDNNHVPYTAYLDLRASYNFGPENKYQIYAAIDNVLDINPPLIPSSKVQVFPGFFPQIASGIYSALGRSYRYGMRATF